MILLAVGWYLRFSLSYRGRGETGGRAGRARRSRHGVLPQLDAVIFEDYGKGPPLTGVCGPGSVFGAAGRENG